MKTKTHVWNVAKAALRNFLALNVHKKSQFEINNKVSYLKKLKKKS